MEQQKGQTLPQNTLKKQPLICPWSASQPYPSTVSNKNRNVAQGSSTQTNHAINTHWSSIPITMDTSKYPDNSQALPINHSSSQFFYFLRLMELFPDTHPATLHTVLTLCKNNFFCAVDKLLYAKRCKTMYNRRQSTLQRFTHSRNHPYCNVNTPKHTTDNSMVGCNNNAMHKTGNKVINNIMQKLENNGKQINNPGCVVKEEPNNQDILKQEGHVSPPSDLQPEFKIPMNPLSPANENPEDLSSTSTKVETITYQ